MLQTDSAIMALLKEQTKALHRETEAEVDLFARLTSVEAYISLLMSFHGFYSPLEERLAGVQGIDEVGLDLVSRRKSHLIRQDLEAVAPVPADNLKIPVCSSLPDVSTVAKAVGCMYVLEGSTLGAQVISREVEKRLGYTAGHGCSFFTGYGPGQTGMMWSKFGKAASAWHQQNPGTTDAIISAASATFSRFKEWLSCRPN